MLLLGLKIFVRIQTFRQRLFAPPPIFCHPDDGDDDGDCGDEDEDDDGGCGDEDEDDDGGCGDHDEDNDGGCGDHDDLCDKRTLDLSEVSIQGLVNHEDIVVEND